MTLPEGRSGKVPSRNGGSPERLESPAHDGPEVVLTINDRLDALERALGTVRRRGMSLKVFSLVRRDEQLVLVLRADAGAPVPERWIAELGQLVDVRQIKVSGIAAAPRS